MLNSQYLATSRHGVYYFRFSIPQKLHPERKQTSLRLSLNTRYPREALRTGQCHTIKKGTRVIFYHLEEYTNGDYGDKTTVCLAGDLRTWVLDKCSLDARDPDIARYPEYVLPEKPCGI